MTRTKRRKARPARARPTRREPRATRWPRAQRDTRRHLAAAEEQLRAPKRSATMKLGQAVVQAAKRPWIGGPRLPLHLYRMWQEGRGVGRGPGAGGGVRA